MPHEPSAVLPRWPALAWWILRLAVLAAVPWALWGRVPLPVAVVATGVLVLLCLAFLGPCDLWWRPLRASGIAVVLWDLLMVAVLIAALYLSGYQGALEPLIVVTAGLVLVRAPLWFQLTGEPHHRSAASPWLRWLAGGVAALLLFGLAHPLHPAPLQSALDCLRPSVRPGGGSLWGEADEPTGQTDPDHLVGPALWTIPEGERVVAGQRETVVTLSGNSGFAVRSAEDGRVLWHLARGRPREVSGSLPGPQHQPDRLHQVGETVIAEFRVPGGEETAHGLSIGYEASTGRLSWCAPGLWNLVSDPHESARFVARDSGTGHHWGLYDAADGQLLTRMTWGGATPEEVSDTELDRVLLSDGRATVWSSSGYSSYATPSGEHLTSVALPPGIDRPLQGLLHVDNVTVLALGRPYEEEFGYEFRHERYALTTHSLDGTELWRSEETGPLVEGQTVVGSTFGGCQGVDKHYGVLSQRGFDGHFVALDSSLSEQSAAVVRAFDGTVASLIDSDLFMANCSMRRHDINGRLHFDSGAVLDPGGVVTEPHNPEHRPLVSFTGNGVVVHPVFHALP